MASGTVNTVKMSQKANQQALTLADVTQMLEIEIAMAHYHLFLLFAELQQKRNFLPNEFAWVSNLTEADSI